MLNEFPLHDILHEQEEAFDAAPAAAGPPPTATDDNGVPIDVAAAHTRMGVHTLIHTLTHGDAGSGGASGPWNAGMFAERAGVGVEACMSMLRIGPEWAQVRPSPLPIARLRAHTHTHIHTHTHTFEPADAHRSIIEALVLDIDGLDALAPMEDPLSARSAGSASGPADRPGFCVCDNKQLCGWVQTAPSLLHQLATLVRLHTENDARMALTAPTRNAAKQDEAANPFDLARAPAVALTILAAAHDCYAPWCSKDGKHAATVLLESVSSALERRGILDDTAPRAGARSTAAAARAQPARYGRAAIEHVVSTLADELLAWCREATNKNAWKTDASVCVRYVAAWVITHLRFPSLTHDRLAHALATAMRFCDDWEATTVWLGASCLAHVVSHASTTDLRLQRELLLESMSRLSASRVPCVLHVLAAARPELLYKIHGAPPAWLPLKARSVAVPLDGAFDIAVKDVLQNAVLVSDTETQTALLNTVAALIHVMGSSIIRHISQVLHVGFFVVSNTGDARCVACVMRVIHQLLPTCPARFTVDALECSKLLPASDSAEASDADSGGDLHCRATNVDHVIGTAMMALTHLRHGLVSAPGVGAAGDDERAILAKLRDAVEPLVLEVSSSLRRLSPEYVDATAAALLSELDRLSVTTDEHTQPHPTDAPSAPIPAAHQGEE